MQYAILGIGQAGLRHFEGFNKIKKLKFIGFTEYNLKKAKIFEKQYKIKHYKNINELLKQKLDFVVISLPHDERSDPITLCVKKKINLLIEKPLALNINELKKILPYTNKRNLIHTISFVHRYREEVLQAYKLIRNNKIGKIKYITETMISEKNPKLPKWIDDKKKSGGGVLIYNAIHSIDKLCFLVNSDVKKVYSEYNNINSKLKVEDTISIIIIFKNKTIANLNAIFAPYKTNPKWETKIFGEKGSIDLNIRKNLEIKSRTLNKKYNYENYYKKNGPNYNFSIQAKSYINCLKKRKSPLVKIEDGIKSVKIVDAIYKSIKQKKVITL